MLYFVGGASRSGKSRLARKLLSQLGVPYFPLDALMMACSKHAGYFGASHQDSPEKRSTALWPFTEKIINNASYHIDNYAFEGDYIFPEKIKSLESKYSSHRFSAVFLGYANADPQQKLQEIRQFSTATDWTREKTDIELLQHINVHIALSATLKSQCSTYGFPYIEAENDSTNYLDDAYQVLTQNS